MKNLKTVLFSLIALVVAGLMMAGPALSQSEDDFAPFPDETISLWHFDEAKDSTIFVDAFGENDGAVANGQEAPNASPGTVNGAQHFAGSETSGAGIDVSPDSSFDWLSTDSFTIEIWLKKGSPVSSGNQVAIARLDADDGMLWMISLVGETGYPRFNLRSNLDSEDPTVIVGSTSITDGEWHHLVGVRDVDKGVLFYVDGVLIGSDEREFAGTFRSSVADINIGYLDALGLDGYQYWFGGALDEIAIYDRALPPSEITAHMQAGLAGKDVTSFYPTADAGDDQTDVEEGSDVTLDGSNSTAGFNETISSYLWEQTDGTTVELSNANSATATFTAPDVDDDSEEMLTFQLTVTNSANGFSSTDSTSVTVVPAASSGDGGGDDGGGCFITNLF